jgi:SH3 domain protein
MRLIIGVLALLPLMAVADTAYVTDNLRLGLHAAEDTNDRAFRMLESGQPMEVLLRTGNYANVRLPDGTEGWVKSGYLVDEKPAKLIVAETMAERDALASELAAAQAAFADPAATIENLQNEATTLMSELDDARTQIAELQEENASIQGLKERYRGSVPLSWVGGAILVCLIAGMLGGLWWTDRSSRKRHGGIRIY